ncbi:MAG: methionyl-tRNA formyltransferase [Peptococcia bacterium]
MKKLSILFMGTPDFAVPSLQALVNEGHTIQTVITQPDRPKGRGQKLAYSPVKEKALELGLPIFQPRRIREPECVAKIKELQPDLICVVAFGQILPADLLAIPKFGCINVHGSLLPAYRGAAPIQRAIMNGEDKTGITTMLMDEGLDTGDMLLQETVEITPEMNSGELHDILAALGARLVVETVRLWPEQKIQAIPQDDELSSYASMLQKEDEKIDWNWEATRIHNQVRGLAPIPGAYTIFRNQKLKIRGSRVIEVDNRGEQAGKVLELRKGQGFVVQCGQGSLLVTEVQPVGKKTMPADSFINGYRLVTGEILTTEG